MNEIQNIKSMLGQYEKVMSDKESIQNTCISPEIKATVYNDLQNRCDEVKKKLLEMIKILPEITDKNSDNSKSKTEKTIKIESIIDTNNDDQRKSWKSNMSSKINAIYDRKLDYVTSKEVFKELYEYMTNVYGIVWEQDFKEWRRDNDGIPKTLDIIYNNSQYKSIFDSILVDKYNNILKVHPDKLSVKEIIEPLVRKNQDKSNGGCATLKKVYLHMENYYNINWDKHMKKYFKENGIQPKTKSDLLYWNHGLIERFRMSVNDMVQV